MGSSVKNDFPGPVAVQSAGPFYVHHYATAGSAIMMMARLPCFLATRMPPWNVPGTRRRTQSPDKRTRLNDIKGLKLTLSYGNHLITI